jgi:hypothetical protein
LPGNLVAEGLSTGATDLLAATDGHEKAELFKLSFRRKHRLSDHVGDDCPAYRALDSESAGIGEAGGCRVPFGSVEDYLGLDEVLLIREEFDELSMAWGATGVTDNDARPISWRRTVCQFRLRVRSNRRLQGPDPLLSD